MVVPFLAAESAAHWLQSKGRERGRCRGAGREEMKRCQHSWRTSFEISLVH